MQVCNANLADKKADNILAAFLSNSYKKKRQYSGCFFIKPPVKLYDDILSRNEILYSSLCKILCLNEKTDKGICKRIN